jgi:hypothetical protein
LGEMAHREAVLDNRERLVRQVDMVVTGKRR